MPPRPRILLLITDLHLGGSPRMVQSLALGLRHHFDLHVCSLAPFPEKPLIPDSLRAAGIPLHTLSLADVSPRSAKNGLAAYRRLLADIRPHLVYSILIHANALATLGKPGNAHKLVHAIHTLQPEPRWHWTLQGAIAQTADAIIAPSQPILDRIAEFGPFRQGIVIPNGIDVEKFARAAPMENRSPDTIRIGYIGRFDPVKRLDLLLHVMVRLREKLETVSLEMVGYGDQEAVLRTLATTLHLAPHVRFHGPTDTPERWYKSFDIHCLPSPVEGFGLTLIESLAAGTPVVAIQTRATAPLVRSGVDGVLVSRPDAASLAAGIQEVMRWLAGGKFDPAGAMKWVANHFSAQAMISTHKRILEKILQD